MKCRWFLAPPQPGPARALADALRLPPLLAQCLLNRGLGDQAAADKFLNPRLKFLADPFLLPNMGAAVERLLLARKRNEPIVIFGDYDVDGVSSTALLLEVLRVLGYKVVPYLPHRMDEGYGLSAEAVKQCLAKSPATLLLSVDCGSTATATIAELKQSGVDVIVLDHHQVASPPPAAVALVNPQLTTSGNSVDSSDSVNSFTELCSVGLSFKLAHALIKRGRETGVPGAAEFDLRPLLDLVALGTIADVVPLIGENRILASIGLERLNTTQRPGLVALKEIAQCSAPLGTYEAGFQLAPRLNAAGRLETAEEALRLLMAPDLNEALPIARSLDACNRERQKIERAIVEEVTAAVRARFKPDADYVIVEGNTSWHIGVVGIVAARVLQHFYRPTIILGRDGAHLRGSGRSIPCFDLAAALNQCEDLLMRHGGHAMAAGLSLARDNLDAFRARLNHLAQAALKPEDMQPVLRLDAEVRLTDLTFECLDALDRLRPMGQGNPAVQFCARKLVLQRPSQRMGSDKQHLKLWVTDGNVVLEAVWWNGAKEPIPPQHFDLAFVPQRNDYNGRRSIQLKILDCCPASPR